MTSTTTEADPLEQEEASPTAGRIEGGLNGIKRLVEVDQKPIGRTPRSNLATYTGLFDHVRKLFAATPLAKRRITTPAASPSTSPRAAAPIATAKASSWSSCCSCPASMRLVRSVTAAATTPRRWRSTIAARSIADVLGLTVDAAWAFFAEEDTLRHGLSVLREVGVGYLRLGQPATELSGGEAQRIKLATELQRAQSGNTLYVLDEPTTGLHASDVDKLIAQLERLVAAGNTVVTIEHEMRVAAVSDWIMDIGPGAGEMGGKLVAAGPPEKIARDQSSRTAPYLAQILARGSRAHGI